MQGEGRKEAFQIGIQSDTMWSMCLQNGCADQFSSMQEGHTLTVPQAPTPQKMFVKQNLIKILIMRGAPRGIGLSIHRSTSDTPCSAAQQIRNENTFRSNCDCMRQWSALTVYSFLHLGVPPLFSSAFIYIHSSLALGKLVNVQHNKPKL